MAEQNMQKFGFLGAGKMANALCQGFINAGHVQAGNIIASHAGTCEKTCMRKLGVKLTLNNVEVVQNCQVLFISVKPHIVPTVLPQVAKYVTKEHLVVSVAAGLTTDYLASELPEGTRIIRVMPNTPSQVGCGASVFSAHACALEEDSQLVLKLLSSVGTCDLVPERLINSVSGLSGSGPAYMYLAIEALSDGGVKMGIPRQLSTRLAAQTLLGAAKMVLETGQHPGELKDAVTSPGGTTICAIHELEKAGFRAALISAVEASANKSKEIGDKDK